LGAPSLPGEEQHGRDDQARRDEIDDATERAWRHLERPMPDRATVAQTVALKAGSPACVIT
jgi:hypothetical protein